MHSFKLSLQVYIYNLNLIKQFRDKSFMYIKTNSSSDLSKFVAIAL